MPIAKLFLLSFSHKKHSIQIASKSIDIHKSSFLLPLLFVMQCVQLYILHIRLVLLNSVLSLFLTSVEYSCRRNGESSGQEVVYFQNEDYPQATSTPNMCLFRISIKDDSICQLRIDFDEFVLDAGSDVNTPCDRDSLELFSGGTTSLGTKFS